MKLVWQIQRPWEEASTGRYARFQVVHALGGRYTFTFAVCNEGGGPVLLTPAPIVQMVLDGVDIGAPQESTSAPMYNEGGVALGLASTSSITIDLDGGGVA